MSLLGYRPMVFVLARVQGGLWEEKIEMWSTSSRVAFSVRSGLSLMTCEMTKLQRRYDSQPLSVRCGIFLLFTRQISLRHSVSAQVGSTTGGYPHSHRDLFTLDTTMWVSRDT